MPFLVALALQPAAAFAPGQVPDGVGLEPQRVQTWRHPAQARLLRGEAWQRFLATEGPGWRVMFDEQTGTPRTLWGGGVAVPTESPDRLARALTHWIDAHAALLGHDPGTLSLTDARHVGRTDTWYVDFDVLRAGLPTWRGGISARVKGGNLVLLQVATAPNTPISGALEISADDAIRQAIEGGPVPGAAHTDRAVVPMLLEQKTLQGRVLRKVWQVRTHTQDPPGIWTAFVDGQTGKVLGVHNEVRFVDGTVTGDHHPRTPVDGLLTSPMPFVTVAGQVDSGTTDQAGDYTITQGAPYLTDLNGAGVNVVNASGEDGAIASTSPDIRWTASDASQAEIDAYVSANHVRAWGQAVAPEVPITSQKIRANVNVTGQGSCNAYYNGAINFLEAGGGCSNTAQVADVVYHEWGHGFHFSSLAGYPDGSLGEGVADVVAVLQTQDNLVGPYFETNGGAVRNVSPNRVYPDDYNPSANAVHSNGLIFGGTMWDLLQDLQAREGDAQGLASTTEIFVGLIKGAADIPATFGEALVADDDDGDLSNGTPHICSLYDAFGLHGLGPSAGQATVLINHEPLVDAPAGRDHPLSVELVALQQECDSGDVSSAVVHYQVDSGDWQEVPLTPHGAAAEGAIPQQPLGSFVAYWIDGDSTDGGPFVIPDRGVVQPFTFVVGDTIEISCEDFELDDGRYSSALLAGDDVEGANDWQWGSPLGEGDDPATAYSGDFVWGNDLGADNFNGQYQPNKINALTSSRTRTGHYTDVFLQYRRWLTVEDATFDQAVILANGEPVWSNFEGDGEQHHIDKQWVSHVVDLGGIADQGGVRIEWQIHSDPGLEFGGWNLDDVCIKAPATADNRLGIDDFVAEVRADTHVVLSWTNPEHAPVEQVRVVRRFDRFPEGADDGDLVFEQGDPELGVGVQIDELNFEAGDSFYAVYAFDGAEWLSWTLEGFNAAQVDLVGGEAPLGWPTDLDGDGLLDPWPRADGSRGLLSACGCSGTGGSPALLSLLGVLLLVRRRR